MINWDMHQLLSGLLHCFLNSTYWQQSITEVGATQYYSNCIDWLPGINQSLRGYQGNSDISRKKFRWYPRINGSFLLSGPDFWAVNQFQFLNLVNLNYLPQVFPSLSILLLKQQYNEKSCLKEHRSFSVPHVISKALCNNVWVVQDTRLQMCVIGSWAKMHLLPMSW